MTQPVPVAKRGVLRPVDFWHPSAEDPRITRPTWDIFLPWPEGVQTPGVVWHSSVAVALTVPVHDGAGAPVQFPVRFWVPGGEQGDVARFIAWDRHEWAPITGWGAQASLVVDSREINPDWIEFVWQFVPGVAPAVPPTA